MPPPPVTNPRPARLRQQPVTCPTINSQNSKTETAINNNTDFHQPSSFLSNLNHPQEGHLETSPSFSSPLCASDISSRRTSPLDSLRSNPVLPPRPERLNLREAHSLENLSISERQKNRLSNTNIKSLNQLKVKPYHSHTTNYSNDIQDANGKSEFANAEPLSNDIERSSRQTSVVINAGILHGQLNSYEDEDEDEEIEEIPDVYSAGSLIPVEDAEELKEDSSDSPSTDDDIQWKSEEKKFKKKKITAALKSTLSTSAKSKKSTKNKKRMDMSNTASETYVDDTITDASRWADCFNCNNPLEIPHSQILKHVYCLSFCYFPFSDCKCDNNQNVNNVCVNCNGNLSLTETKRDRIMLGLKVLKTIERKSASNKVKSKSKDLPCQSFFARLCGDLLIIFRVRNSEVAVSTFIRLNEILQIAVWSNCLGIVLRRKPTSDNSDSIENREVLYGYRLLNNAWAVYLGRALEKNRKRILSIA